MFSEDAGDTTIPSHIRLHLVTPKGYVTFGKPGFAAIRVTVPEAAIDKYDDMRRTNDEVGLARQRFDIATKANTKFSQ